jgi:hypothetical protein
VRWLSRFAILLYLSLLCTPQAFAVHDARLSPLADSQFHAITPIQQHYIGSTERDVSDDPQPALLLSTDKVQPVYTNVVLAHGAVKASTRLLTLPQARAPPVIAAHPI